MTYLNTPHKVTSSRLSLKRKTALLLLTFLTAPYTWAATAIATVSTNEVTLDEPFQLQILIDESLSNSDLNISALDEDFLYSQPSVSSSTSIINGKATRETSWLLTLVAKKEGTFTIPAFNLKGNKTAPIQIEVSASTTQKNNVQNIQVKGNLNTDEGYIGESFIYSLTMMIGSRVDNPHLHPPQGEGLIIEQLGEDVRSENIINGRHYIVINRQYSVTPTQSGQLTIEGGVLTGTELRASRWNNVLKVPFERTSSPLSLNIKPKPENYQGFWLPTPSLKLTQRFENENIDANKSLKVGEPINRELTLSIKNIAQSAMPDLNITYPDTVRVYSDKPVYSMDGSHRIMTIKQVIIPREAGTIELPPISINWFNTKTEQEEVSSLDGLVLDVKAAETSSPLVDNQHILLPDLQTKTQIIKEVDAGFWPMLSAFFAALWLITLGFYFQQKKSTKPLAKKQAEKTDENLSLLIQAVKEKEFVAVSTYYRLWDKSSLSAELKEEIDLEINAMMASRYSEQSSSITSEPNTWQNAHLITLLTQASKNAAQIKTTSSLKNLTP